MAQLQVHISMLDHAGVRRLDVELTEVSRLDVDRDPLYVFARLQGLVERAVAQLHEQVLQIDQPARSTYSGDL